MNNMARHIFKCEKCGSYIMDERCKCGCKAVTARPAKYSPDDKYADLRRDAKREEAEKRGLI